MPFVMHEKKEVEQKSATSTTHPYFAQADYVEYFPFFNRSEYDRYRFEVGDIFELTPIQSDVVSSSGKRCFISIFIHSLDHNIFFSRFADQPVYDSDATNSNGDDNENNDNESRFVWVKLFTF